MEYSIFPTLKSAQKWARENLTPKYYDAETVKESGFQSDGRYYAGEYWIWYRESDILS